MFYVFCVLFCFCFINKLKYHNLTLSYIIWKVHTTKLFNHDDSNNNSNSNGDNNNKKE